MPEEIAAKFDVGSVYLIEERQPRLSYRVFNGLITPESPGLCVSIFPGEKVRQLYGVGDSRIVWLAETPADDHVRPTALNSLRNTIATFAETHGNKSVVLLDGLERLITRNGFDKALGWVEQLSEFVAQGSVIVLVPFSPETVTRKDLANLERVLMTFEGSRLDEQIAAAEMRRILEGHE